MIEATTPTLTLTLPDNVDLSTAKEILVTFSQSSTSLTKTLNDGVVLSASNILAVTLTQEETLLFTPNKKAFVQVNWIGNNNVRMATSIGQINVEQNLIPQVIEP